MKKENKKNIHIGELVEKAFNKSELTKSQFAERIGVQNQNVNRMFKNEDWSVIKLIEAGEALGTDFSFLFGKKKVEKSKMILQIEIEDDKFNDVLKSIENKELYDILKK